MNESYFTVDCANMYINNMSNRSKIIDKHSSHDSLQRQQVSERLNDTQEMLLDGGCLDIINSLLDSRSLSVQLQGNTVL